MVTVNINNFCTALQIFTGSLTLDMKNKQTKLLQALESFF